jgi:hypothetical protein
MDETVVTTVAVGHDGSLRTLEALRACCVASSGALSPLAASPAWNR